MKKLQFLAFILLIITIFSQTPEQDKVYVLDHVNYTHDYYSGYLPSGISERVHYVFFQSQTNPKKDPLLLFLNGGPGCSSLSSLFHQNGPFIFQPGQQHLSINPNSWNKRANVLYLQLPAGVGFSTIANTSRIHNDIQTALEAYFTLQQFYHRFPDYRARELYISGHGYAAVFLANTARIILEFNSDPFNIQGKINLKGLLLGNPCVAVDQCYASGARKKSYYHYQYLYKRAFFTRRQFQQFKGVCALDYEGFECFQQKAKLDKHFNDTNSSSLNIYDKCYKTVQGLSVVNSGCEDQSGVETYLNQQAIKQNWHVDTNINWTVCNWKIFNEYQPGNNSYHLMNYLRQKQMRLWIFSGDFDSQVPITGTKRWIHRFKQQYQVHTKKIWRQWWIPGLHKGQDQVGGYIWQLDGLTFVTVRGAGFRAGIDQPVSMEQVLNGFLDGQSLPKNPNLQPMINFKGL